MAKGADKLRKSRQEQPDKVVEVASVFSSNFDKPLAVSDLLVDEELRTFIPPLQKEEAQLLRDSILQEGVRDALLYWEDPKRGPLLVDGHNRHQVISELEQSGEAVRYRLQAVTFADYETVKDWMIINQLGRRNLTDEQRSYLRGLRYNREKASHGGLRKSRDQNDPLKPAITTVTGLVESVNEAKDQNDPLTTSARLAEEYKVGEATIKRDGQLADGLDKIGTVNPSLKRAILAGEEKVKKSTLQKLSTYQGRAKMRFQAAEDIDRFVNRTTKRSSTQQLPAQQEDFNLQKRAVLRLLTKLSLNHEMSDLHRVHDQLTKLKKFFE